MFKNVVWILSSALTVCAIPSPLLHTAEVADKTIAAEYSTQRLQEIETEIIKLQVERKLLLERIAEGKQQYREQLRDVDSQITTLKNEAAIVRTQISGYGGGY